MIPSGIETAHGVDIEWQYIGFTSRFYSERFYNFKMFGCRRFQFYNNFNIILYNTIPGCCNGLLALYISTLNVTKLYKNAVYVSEYW